MLPTDAVEPAEAAPNGVGVTVAVHALILMLDDGMGQHL